MGAMFPLCGALSCIPRSFRRRLSAEEGGLLLDRTANHFFAFMRRRGVDKGRSKASRNIDDRRIMTIGRTISCLCFDFVALPADIPDCFDLDEGTNKRREKQADDVFVLVKEYISSVELRQPPLLALTAESRPSFPMTTTRS